MEIRPVELDEAPAFLKLLCECFHLDLDRAGSVFYTEPFFDLKRKWALFEGDQIITILTTSHLEFGWGNAIGIAGVATRVGYEGRGYASLLLERALEQAARDGEGAAMLFAHDDRLYKKHGFVVCDTVVKGSICCDPTFDTGEPMPIDEVKGLYAEWSEASPARLRRNEKRWKYWNWGMRCCEPFAGGYICIEASLVREAVIHSRAPNWPVLPGTEWVGMESLNREIQVPLREVQPHLLVMSRGFPEPPIMFMTDQF